MTLSVKKHPRDFLPGDIVICRCSSFSNMNICVSCEEAIIARYNSTWELKAIVIITPNACKAKLLSSHYEKTKGYIRAYTNTGIAEFWIDGVYNDYDVIDITKIV